MVAPTCRPAPCALSDTNLLQLVAAAREAGADILLVGGIQKMSTLVQWAKVQAIDVTAERVVLDRLYSFRGDSDEAWSRARAFISRQLKELPAASLPGSPTSAEPALIKLAVFDFELHDFSGGAGIAGDPADDIAQLDLATRDARRLIAESGRYQLVDVSAVEDKIAKERGLRDCNGCDAAIALRLGAEQSFVGVVTRISRTEYVVSFRIRDARTGSPVLARQSELRIGANYSWNRGAAWLVRNRLLDAR
jgi:hypothetical protein